MVCTPCCRQFSLLLWKNWLLQKRKIILTIVEVLLPVLFAAILLAIRSKTASNFVSEPTTEGRFEVKTAPTNVTVPPMQSRKRLAFTPNTDFTRKIINRTLNMMSIPFAPELGFDTEKELEYNVSSTDYVLAGVVFLDSSFQDSQTFNSTITYKIRMKSEEKVPGTNVLRSKDWRTEFLMPPYKVVGGPRQNTSMGPGGTDPGYLVNGFLVLQRALDASIIKELGGNENEMKTFLKKYAYPPYLSDVFTFILSTQFPFIVMLSFIVISPTICSEITAEKEKKLKEAMKLMGLKVWLNWLAWFLKYLIFMILSVGLMTLFFHVKLKNGAIINFANASVTFVFLLLYTISIIMSCFNLFDNYFSRHFFVASLSAAAGALFFFLSYFPFFSLYSTFDTTSTTIRFVLSIIPNLGMSYGCTILSRFELVGISLTWKNLHYGSNSSDSFSMLHVFISFLISILISMFLTWYIENVNPGEFGTPQPFYFPFLKRYWCGFKKGSVDGSMLNIQPDFGDRSEYFEPLTSNSNNNIGIQIRNLTKVFKKGTKPAVNNLSLDICEGKITALLGHNGAGKTTTMSMLTGFMPPTRGTAYINGNDIRYEMPMIRKNLGLCPQFNILFDKLTVKEHLEFFAILKGCSNDELEGEVTNMIRMLNLEVKTDVFSKSLSGGMKRKLSVGISLIAGSNFVILDEPSSGMDPEARRQMWDLLKTQQKGRTMLLTTHYMDEADYLGDKIAIMADGVVHCYGSSMFLKRKYGIGYHMTMVKAPKCDVTLVDSLIKSKIPDAAMESNAGAELTYVLPKEYSSKFPELFAELERDGDKIGVDSFGTSVTTLEEVFIKVGEMCDRDASDSNENGKVVRVESSDNFIAVTSSLSYFYVKVKYKLSVIDWKLVKESRISGFALKLQQLQAMFVKKIFHTTRNWILSIIQLLIPVIFAIVACIVVSIIPKVADPPAFLLDLSAYKQTITPYASIVNDSYTPGDASRQNCFMQKMLNVKPTLAYLNDYSIGYFNETSMDNYVVGIGEKNSYDYRTKYQLAVEIGYDYLTGFFNDESYHTIAMALSLIDNFWLSCLLSSQYSIKTINHPLPLSFELKATVNDSKALLSGFVFSYCLMFGIAFLIASFIIFLVNERVSGAKGSQYVSGATSNVFWFANFIWDYFNYLIPSVLVVIVIVAFQLEGFSSGNNAGYIFLSLLLYGWSVLPSIYILSFFFSKASSGFVWAIIINIFTGTVASVTILLLEKFEDLKTIKSILEWMFFVLFPNFCFQRSLQDVDANYQYTKTCATINATIPLDKFCAGAKALNQTNHYLSWVYPGIGKPLIFMSIQGLIFFIILLIFESDLLQNIRTKFASQSVAVTESDSAIYPNNTSSEEDSDVLEEKAKVLKLEMSDLMSEDNMLVMKQLTKVYSGGFLAVSNLCLTVPRGECFGLLGVNGAGKTSTFKMLTGGETISAGNVYLKGIDVAKKLAKTRPFVGYCPQFDALIDQLTVKETMVMHARLRGIDRTVIDIVTDDLIEKLVLRKYKNKMAGKLSGGNKRKLGIAIALIGDPLLVFLDEPSAGMDPVARRELWNSVEAARDSGSTIILTSHSMEECEALCTRLAIMVNGRFKCLGSCQHLKSKFGSGYTVSFKVQQGPNLDNNITNIIAVKNFVAAKYPGSVLEFEGEGLLTYRIEKNANGQQNTLAGVFTSVELFKESFKLEDYSVGQATLEQVFITFAKGQREEGDGKKSKKSLRPFCKKMCCCCRDC
ncbi:hypothetical protein HELRODRAFT_82844 [Helobdella robusta]|uniref:ABC transporter domain-containing protein n=1 Tax=Helobdella robusta TaxID=6412 RepID=T1G4X2_HELRO|nr:hypothetical protein HELRODRAFT_82844 [Helobdella robusta]ESO00555.1 hypothetical protein HELRODRAFT_82844 [Helobdella robusta]